MDDVIFMEIVLLQELSKNLKYLCGFEKSVSDICRMIEINRQQFSKYLNGTTRPSDYNLQRICDHFNIRPNDIFLPHHEFMDRHPRGKAATGNTSSGASKLNDAFMGQTSRLKKYLGYYISHCHSSAWPGHVLTAIIHFYEKDGMICVRSLERSRDPVEGTLYISKYDGHVALLGGRIFVMEFQSHTRDALVETVLYPVGRGQLKILNGVTFGISSKKRQPYTSRTIWKYLGEVVDLREAMKSIGLFPLNSRDIEPKILNGLKGQTSWKHHNDDLIAHILD